MFDMRAGPLVPMAPRMYAEERVPSWERSRSVVDSLSSKSTSSVRLMERRGAEDRLSCFAVVAMAALDRLFDLERSRSLLWRRSSRVALVARDLRDSSSSVVAAEALVFARDFDGLARGSRFCVSLVAPGSVR